MACPRRPTLHRIIWVAPLALLWACNEGFDPLMKLRCMWGNKPPDANFVHDTTDCPTVDYTNDANPHWIVGANKGRCDGEHDLKVQITNVDATTRTMQLTWSGDTMNGYTAEMHHGAGVVCSSSNENDFKMANSVRVPFLANDGKGNLAWLKGHHEVKMQGHGGMYQVSFALSFVAGGQDRWLEISLRPRNPWWDEPVPGHVVFKNNNICTLDAAWFGIAGLCPSGCPGPWTNVDIDWGVVLTDAISSCWPGIAGTDWRSISPAYVFQTAGFSDAHGGTAGSMTVSHRRWREYR